MEFIVYFFLSASRYCEAMVLAAPIIAFALFVAALVAPEPRSKSFVVFAAIITMTLGSAYYLRFRNAYLVQKSSDDYKKFQRILYGVFRPSSVNLALFHPSAIILTVILLMRLEATDTFGGSVQNLDFGDKAGGGSNIAMGKDVNTVTHCLQGFLACLLSFPAIAGILARFVTLKTADKDEESEEEEQNSVLHVKPNIPALLFIELFAACTTVYPSYSAIKRFVKDGEAFAKTSHMNNVTEWCLGYFLGMGIGWFLTVLLQCRLFRLAGLNSTETKSVSLFWNKGTNLRNDDSKIQEVVDLFNIGPEHQYGFGCAKNYEESSMSSRKVISTTIGIISKIVLALLLLLSATSLVTGILIGKTWDYPKNDAMNVQVIGQNVGIYVVITSVMIWFSAKKWPFNSVH